MPAGVTVVPLGAAVVPVLTANSLRKSKGPRLSPVAAVGVKTVKPTLGTGQQPHFCIFCMKQQLVSRGQLVWLSHTTSARRAGTESA